MEGSRIMATEDELHRRFEALEARLAAARKDLGKLTEEQRADLGDALTALSESLAAHEDETAGN